MFGTYNFLVKPTSGKCNIRCKYCHYLKDNGFLPSHDLINFINGIEFDEGSIVNICFQGGEPLLLGIEYYKEIMKSVRRDVLIKFSFQTNGTLIDEDWTLFFKENDCLIGVSLDGDESVHNANRQLFTQTYAGVKLLQKYNVDFNILTTLNNQTISDPTGYYDFMVKNKFKHIQLIPLFNYEVEKEKLTSFIETLLKINKELTISNFDEVKLKLNGYNVSSCIYSETCHSQNVIECDGYIYFCDFLVNDSNVIGHIHNPKSFVADLKRTKKRCLECDLSNICGGGCPAIDKQIELTCHIIKTLCENISSK